jgi:hypothetical protein
MPRRTFKEQSSLSDRITPGAAAGIPDAVAPLIDVMSSYPAHWALCGGWAVDAWLGRISREHGDLDISVFVDDQRALFEHLAGWQLLAHDPAWAPGGNDRWWEPARTLGPRTHIHARPPHRSGAMPADGIATDEDGFSQEFYLEDRDGTDWILHRTPRLAMPVTAAVRPSPWGVPAVVPEVLLFFKAQDLRRRDHADFHELLPQLSAEQRAWLRDAVALLRHPWSERLEA